MHLVGENYDQELLRVSPSTPDPLQRTLSFHLPDGPAGNWRIVVGTTLRQGGTIVHHFPLRVERR